MKSIKEKSEELVEKRIELSREESIAYFQGIEDGANYVLDILEKELLLENNRNLNDYGKALVWRLKNCIKQLKK